MRAFVTGIYPRSEQLVQATRDLDLGRTTEEAVGEQVERDLAELVSVQQAAGLDLLSDWMLGWQDLFRPLLEATDGLETGALTRFLDTNTFYRAPHATTAMPKLTGPLDERYLPPVPGPKVVTLPSPYALSEGTGVPATAIAENVLKPVIESLDAELVVLSEPFFGREQGSPDVLAEPLQKLAGGPKLALQLTFCNAREPLQNGLAELPVDAIGIDFYSTSIDALPSTLDKQLLAGVLDARNSLLEEPREIAAFAAQLEERV